MGGEGSRIRRIRGRGRGHANRNIKGRASKMRKQQVNDLRRRNTHSGVCVVHIAKIQEAAKNMTRAEAQGDVRESDL